MITFSYSISTLPPMPESVVRAIPALRDWDTLLRKWVAAVKLELETPKTISIGWDDLTGTAPFAALDHTHDVSTLHGCWPYQIWFNGTTGLCHTITVEGSGDQIRFNLDRAGT